MTKTTISAKIDGALYELLKQKNINISGLIETLLKDYLTQNATELEKKTAEISARVKDCVWNFEWYNFYGIRSKYAEKMCRQGLRKMGYTDEEIQQGYDIAKQEYEKRYTEITPSEITIVKGTPTDWKNEEDKEEDNEANSF